MRCAFCPREATLDLVTLGWGLGGLPCCLTHLADARAVAQAVRELARTWARRANPHRASRWDETEDLWGLLRELELRDLNDSIDNGEKFNG